MSAYDDPALYEEKPSCTCANRALRPDEMVVYEVPRKTPNGWTLDTLIFAKDCPVHGYTKAEP